MPDDKSTIDADYRDLLARHGWMERMRALGVDDLLPDVNAESDADKQFVLDIAGRYSNKQTKSLALKRPDVTPKQLRFAIARLHSNGDLLDLAIAHPNADQDLYRWALTHPDQDLAESAAGSTELWDRATPDVAAEALNSKNRVVLSFALACGNFTPEIIREHYRRAKENPENSEQKDAVLESIAQHRNAPQDVIDDSAMQQWEKLKGGDTLGTAHNLRVLASRVSGVFADKVLSDIKSMGNNAPMPQFVKEFNSYRIGDKWYIDLLRDPDVSWKQKAFWSKDLFKVAKHMSGKDIEDIVKCGSPEWAKGRVADRLVEDASRDGLIHRVADSLGHTPAKTSKEFRQSLLASKERCLRNLGLTLDSHSQDPALDDASIANILTDSSFGGDYKAHLFSHANFGELSKTKAIGDLSTVPAKHVSSLLERATDEQLVQAMKSRGYGQSQVLDYLEKNPKRVSRELLERMVTGGSGEYVLNFVNNALSGRSMYGDSDAYKLVVESPELFNNLAQTNPEGLTKHLKRIWNKLPEVIKPEHVKWYLENPNNGMFGDSIPLPEEHVKPHIDRMIAEGKFKILSKLMDHVNVPIDEEQAKGMINSLVNDVANDNAPTWNKRLVNVLLTSKVKDPAFLQEAYSKLPGKAGEYSRAAILENPKCPIELHRLGLQDKFALVSDTALENGNFTLQELKDNLSNAVKSRHLYMVDRLREVISKRDADAAFDERVGVLFDTGRARKLRDHILERSPQTKNMHPKEVAKFIGGDWSKFRDKHGLVNAEKIQEYLDTEKPHVVYNVSHTTYGEDGWDGVWEDYADREDGHYGPLVQQRHNDVESQVFQANVTNDMLEQISKAGLTPRFNEIMSDCASYDHPAIENCTLGWIRYTGKPENGIFIDEVQSDFGGFMRRKVESGNMSKEEAQKMSEIVFGGRHPSVAMLEAFHQHLRDKGHAGCKVAIHSLPVKAAISLGDFPNRPPPGHFKVGYEDAPKKMGMEPSTYSKDNMLTQSNPNLQGKPTWQHELRRSEQDDGLTQEDLDFIVSILKK